MLRTSAFYFELKTVNTCVTFCSLMIILLSSHHFGLWKTIEQEKGHDAAVTMGSEAAVYAAEASDSNDLLEKVLPPTVADYVALVKAHLSAGRYTFLDSHIFSYRLS